MQPTMNGRGARRAGARVIAEEELSKLDPADSLIPVSDRVLIRGNAIAVVSTDSSPDYRSTLEECFAAA